MSESSGLLAWKALQETKGIGPKRLADIARRLNRERRGAEDLVGRSPDDLVKVGLSPTLAERAASALADPAAPELPPPGVEIVSPDDERYPLDRLLADSVPLPVILFVAGRIDLLRAGGLAMAGSRQPADEARDYAVMIAEECARNRTNVVSGLADGIDAAGHRAALGAGGTTAGVLACGFARRTGGMVLDTENADSALVVSQFSPNDEWTPFRAMERNGTIAALADAVVVVAANTKGGSWEMAKLCLRSDKPLFVVDFPTDVARGNRALIADGAQPLSPSDPGALFEIVAGTETARGAPALKLFG